MKKILLVITILGIVIESQAQDQTINGKLTVNNASNYSKTIQFG